MLSRCKRLWFRTVDEAWLGIRGIDPSACLHMLQALEGAVRGVGKKDLPEAVKAGLWEFFEERRKGGEG